jgi:hypothetical protein
MEMSSQQSRVVSEIRKWYFTTSMDGSSTTWKKEGMAQQMDALDG